MLTTPETLTFDVPNTDPPATTHRIACYQWGEDDAPRAALCVHGLTRNGRDFDYMAQALASDCRVLCPDMPGRGKSGWRSDPAQYNYPSYVADIGFLLKSLRLAQVDWIGTSMGGIIGMMAANAMPGVIRALVLNDVGCVVSAAGMRRILSYPPSKSPCPTRAEAEATLRERCGTFGIHDEAHWQHIFAYGIQERNGCFKPAYDPAIMAAYSKDRGKDAVINDIDLWNLWEAVTKIPVLLIRGIESDILTRETAIAMQSRHPNLTLKEIPGCGHAPALMDEAQITMIKEWLEAL